MSDKLFRNMTHIGNVKNEVNTKLNAVQSTLSSVETNFMNTSLQQNRDISDMKLLLNEEVKDIRAANK